ncbi:unnamed protein product [Urochloa humidicola]
MQKNLGAKSAARRRPLRVLSANKARPAPESLPRKPPPPAAAAGSAAAQAAEASAAAADAALDRLLLARSDIAGIISQIDELISDALRHETVSKRGKQEIESFNGFLSDTKDSLKKWSSRLNQALETDPAKPENVSKHTVGTCSDSVAKGNDKLIWSSSSNLHDTDPVASPCSNFTDADMIVSPSPLVSWRTGACMVDSGKQLFLLTPLPKAKACSSRCPTSKTQMKTTSSMDPLNLASLPVWKLTVSDDDHPDQEQSVKVKEGRSATMTPHVAKANKTSLEDRLRSPCTFSIQKSMRAPPKSCLKTSFSSKQQLFSPIPEGSRKEDIDSSGPSRGDKHSESSDEVSKDLASRYDIFGLNQSTKSTYRTREAQDPLQWYLSPLKVCVLMDPQDDKPLPTPARSNMKGEHDVSDDKPIQTPAVHNKTLLGTPWRGLESTNLKGRLAGETTLKKELWTRFEAASPHELHFNKSLFQKTDGKCFLDMLEEAS